MTFTITAFLQISALLPPTLHSLSLSLPATRSDYSGNQFIWRQFVSVALLFAVLIARPILLLLDYRRRWSKYQLHCHSQPKTLQRYLNFSIYSGLVSPGGMQRQQPNSSRYGIAGVFLDQPPSNMRWVRHNNNNNQVWNHPLPLLLLLPQWQYVFIIFLLPSLSSSSSSWVCGMLLEKGSSQLAKWNARNAKTG